MVLIDDVHEPLVSKADFEKVQEVLSKRRKAGGADKPNRRYLLSGLMRCERRGFTFLGRPLGNKQKRYRYYVDGGHHRGGNDNLNTHTPGAFYGVFEPAKAREYVRRSAFCYTPKHGSWLNIAENEVSSMTRQCLTGRRIGDLALLREEIGAWSIDVTDTQRGVDWQMTIDDSRCKLKSVYPKKFCSDRPLVR